MRRLAIVLAGLALQGCADPVICTLKASFGIRITAWDTVTRDLVDSTPTGILTAGAYREVMEPDFNDAILRGALERPGIYDIEVTAPGYRPWEATGVKVRMDRHGCHVELTDLYAFMVRTRPEPKRATAEGRRSWIRSRAWPITGYSPLYREPLIQPARLAPANPYVTSGFE